MLTHRSRCVVAKGTCRWKAPRIANAARVHARATETILALAPLRSPPALLARRAHRSSERVATEVSEARSCRPRREENTLRPAEHGPPKRAWRRENARSPWSRSRRPRFLVELSGRRARSEGRKLVASRPTRVKPRGRAKKRKLRVNPGADGARVLVGGEFGLADVGRTHRDRARWQAARRASRSAI